MIDDACILVFVRYPESGMVKKRLSLVLDDDEVVELYRCFIVDTINLVSGSGLSFFICYTPSYRLESFIGWLGRSYRYIPQIGDDLGGRMMNSFRYAFEMGYNSVLLIGSDSPDLPGEYIMDGYNALKSNDIVLGPAYDGGYYLIGLREHSLDPCLFDGIEWGTDRVYDETVRRCLSKGYRLSELPYWWDIDTYDDLRGMIERSRGSSFMGSHTMRYILNRGYISKKL